MATLPGQHLSGLQMRRAFDEHYKRASPPAANQTRMQKLRYKQANQRTWRSIATNHRANHVELKRALLEAIRSADFAEVGARHFTTTYAGIHSGRTGPENKASFAQDMLRAEMRHLRTLDALIRAEQNIGDGILNTMLTYDNARVVPVRASVNRAVRMVRKWRRRMVRGYGVLQRLQHFAARRLRFMRDRFARGAGNTLQAIGTGNQDTQLGLWIRRDNNGHIIDRTVIKDVWFDGSEDAWEDAIYWRHVEDPINKVLCEAHIMERLRDTQSDDVVRLRSWNLLVEHLVFRMQMEYCPYGDTTRVYNHFRDLDQPIPEAFIWRIFESLVNAGLLMEQGNLTVPVDDWLGIIHMDIKPANTFLGLHPQSVPARDNWATYPSVKLGDYGLAIETNSQDPRNGRDFPPAGTRGYMAPEQTFEDVLTARTNVFGVGITVMQLMSRNEPVGVQDSWEAAQQGSDDPDDFPGLTADAKQDYSEELVELVEHCVEQDANDRPTFSTLRDRIRECTGLATPARVDLANGMRARIAPLQLQTLGL